MREQDVYIRPITRQDTANILKWRNNPRVSANFINRDILTEQEHINWMDNMINQGKTFQFIIADVKNGKDIGSVYLRDIDRLNRKAEFGIFIGEDCARGKGFGTKAARLALGQAFGKMGLNKVFLRVLADNTSAVKSYEKAGFRREGLFRGDVLINGQPIDVIFMAVLMSEWKMLEMSEYHD